jgi:hypothetical protein
MSRYDSSGNVTPKATDGTTTTYQYDYATRLIALGVSGATTTFGYDAFGVRVLQTGTSNPTLYPQAYSVAGSSGTSAQFAVMASDLAIVRDRRRGNRTQENC